MKNNPFEDYVNTIPDRQFPAWTYPDGRQPEPPEPRHPVSPATYAQLAQARYNNPPPVVHTGYQREQASDWPMVWVVVFILALALISCVLMEVL